jgi:hypothetical protein
MRINAALRSFTQTHVDFFFAWLDYRVMPTFFHKIHAVRVGADCRVIVDGRQLLANAGTWIVTDQHGLRRCLSHAQFMAEYEPADNLAREYLAAVTVPLGARNP